MGDIMATDGDADTNVAFKNCAPFTKRIIHINDKYIDTAENTDITMSIYNLIKYSDNYSDTSGGSWQFKRYESPITNDGNPNNLTTDNSPSLKFKSSILVKPAAVGNNGVLKGPNIAVPLKYLSNF